MRRRLVGTLRVPGDKSITHRALIFSTLARGECTVAGLSPAQDCVNSAKCLEQIGLEIVSAGSGALSILSPGVDGLKAPQTTLDAGNSGTTMRLLAGLLSGRQFKSVLDGDSSLRSRPMGRVLSPLQEMGARFAYLQKDSFAPFEVLGASLHGFDFDLKVASAQVQTALLLAGLQADGITTVNLPAAVRDHTTRMFSTLGVPFEFKDDNRNAVVVRRMDEPVAPFHVMVPADISSAAFFMVAAASLPGSDVTLPELVLNPGRDLVVEVLVEMGADITVAATGNSCGETIGSVRVRGGDRLRGVTISGDRIARGVDEIPALAVAGALCDGEFRVEGAEELRVKESDRIAAVVANLQSAGAAVCEFEDGFAIRGSAVLVGDSKWYTFDDHRMAMSGMIASLVAQSPVRVDHPSCVAVSYPNFAADLNRLVVQ